MHPSRTRRAGRARPAFSLLEAMVVAAVLAIGVPALVALMRTTSASSVDQATLTRATMLAQGVLERVMADVASPAPGLGFAALTSPATYVESPSTGLRARLARMSAAYPATMASWTLDVGPTIDGLGAPSPTGPFRIITVHVPVAPETAGAALDVNLRVIVGDL